MKSVCWIVASLFAVAIVSVPPVAADAPTWTFHNNPDLSEPEARVFVASSPRARNAATAMVRGWTTMASVDARIMLNTSVGSGPVEVEWQFDELPSRTDRWQTGVGGNSLIVSRGVADEFLRLLRAYHTLRLEVRADGTAHRFEIPLDGSSVAIDELMTRCRSG